MSYRQQSKAQEPEDMEENVECDLCPEEVEEGDKAKRKAKRKGKRKAKAIAKAARKTF